MIQTQPDVAGVVLAGGLALRMGGGDKTLRILGGRPMLAHIVERLRPQIPKLALSANGDPLRFAQFGHPVLADLNEELGPLGGVLAALRWAQRLTGVRWLMTVPSDTPFLPEDLLKRLRAGLTQDSEGVVACSRGRKHPTIALWPVTLADALAQWTAGTHCRSIRAWIDLRGWTTIDIEGDEGIDPFLNVNTPADLTTAEDHVRGLR